jgi:predicted Zn-dependent peptidase
MHQGVWKFRRYKLEFRRHQLSNGLTVIGELNDSARSMGVGFFVRAGARDETEPVAGVSHFLEHMLFKGTASRTAQAVNLEFDQMGAKYNAFTSEESTVFFAAVLPEFQERVVSLWCDLMRPALRDEDFEVEKGVILEEIAMYEDMPHYDVLDRCRRLHFGRHSCGHSVLGSVESIKAIRSEQMRGYFESRYSPDNIVLAATGRVDWEGLVRQAELLCGSWKPTGPKRELGDSAGTGQSERVGKEKIQREHICMMTAAPSAQDPMRYEASVLGNILGDDTNSRLYWALIDPALADSAEMDYDAMDGVGAYYIYVSCDPAQAEEATGTVRQCLAAVKRDGVSQDELEASKNKICASLTLNGEIPMGRLVPLGFGWSYRREYLPLADELKRIAAITRSDINRILERYPLERISTLRLGPAEK